MKFINACLMLICLSIIGLNKLHAQNLSFSQPINFLPAARTDKAIDITNFKGGFFVTWKEIGATGNIHVCYLGKQYDTHFSTIEATVADEKSAFAPVLRVVNNRIYTLWLGADGNIKYLINNSDTSFNTQKINTLTFTNGDKLRAGITATVINNQIMIASHADNKNNIVVALIEVDDNGILKPAALQTVPDVKSDEYPFIVTLTNNTIRLCYKEASDQSIHYKDFNTSTKTWTNQTSICKAKSKVSPAAYHAFNTQNLCYIWKGNKKDNHIYYTTEHEQTQPQKEQQLPDYFSTAVPVSICNVDSKKFIMAFIGEDQKFYLSYFTNYNPARWMEDMLYPAKGSLTLKDIVIPGSHDAGMSILNGTGGTQASSINPCNVLTQRQNIGQQLNAGIRMFDLRVGSFNNKIYTKHCSSDCMADAIGGGYGERFKDVLDSVKVFLNRHNKEFIIFTISHFCAKEASEKDVADSIFNALGKKYIYNNQSKSIDQTKLNELAGKVVITFEQYSDPTRFIDSNSMASCGKTFLNIRRAYAATNQINKLLTTEEAFFTSMKSGVNKNDLIRLDWQLTQSSDEAALVCNDFQDDKLNPVLNGVMLLTNVVKKNQSITDMATVGNKFLPAKVNEWISSGVINKRNKPNILYVDVAGAWITDYCVGLNETPVYN